MQLLQATLEATASAANAVAIELTPTMMLSIGFFVASFLWGIFTFYMKRNDHSTKSISDIKVSLATQAGDIKTITATVNSIKDDVKYLKERRS